MTYYRASIQVKGGTGVLQVVQLLTHDTQYIAGDVRILVEPHPISVQAVLSFYSNPSLVVALGCVCESSARNYQSTLHNLRQPQELAGTSSH